MKRGWNFVLAFGLILVVSLSFVSAGFWSDFWNKVSGKEPLLGPSTGYTTMTWRCVGVNSVPGERSLYGCFSEIVLRTEADNFCRNKGIVTGLEFSGSCDLPNPTPYSETCVDSDVVSGNSRQYGTKGTLRIGEVTFDDACHDDGSGKLRELWCKSSTIANWEDVNCPTGTSCVNGACATTTPPPAATCVDSDVTTTYPDGKNPNVKGSVTLGSYAPLFDNCSPNGAGVSEYYCEDNQVKLGFISCPSGQCSNGVCVTTPEPTTGSCFWPPTIKTQTQYDSEKSANAYHGVALTDNVFVITNINTGTGAVLGTYTDPSILCLSGKVYTRTGNHADYYSSDLEYKNSGDRVGSWTLGIDGYWTKPAPAACTDSDGENPRVKGSTVDAKGGNTDFCNIGHASVTEYYCNGSEAKAKIIQCPTGTQCVYGSNSGACVAIPGIVCGDYDFDCDGRIITDDADLVSVLWRGGTTINTNLVNSKTCAKFKTYLNNLLTSGVTQISLAESTRVATEISKCSPTPTPETTCTDSDASLGDKAVYVKGEVNSPGQVGWEDREDVCVDENNDEYPETDFVSEGLCEDGLGRHTPLRCPFGCSEGACNPEPKNLFKVVRENDGCPAGYENGGEFYVRASDDPQNRNIDVVVDYKLTNSKDSWVRLCTKDKDGAFLMARQTPCAENTETNECPNGYEWQGQFEVGKDCNSEQAYFITGDGVVEIVGRGMIGYCVKKGSNNSFLDVFKDATGWCSADLYGEGYSWQGQVYTFLGAAQPVVAEGFTNGWFGLCSLSAEIPELPEPRVSCVDSDADYGDNAKFNKGSAGKATGTSLLRALFEGETTTVSIDNKRYDISINFISSTTVKLNINDKVTKVLSESGYDKLSDGNYVQIMNISVQDYAGGTKKVDFFIGSKFEDYCTNNGVVETGCSPAGLLRAEQVACPNGCSNGACTTAPGRELICAKESGRVAAPGILHTVDVEVEPRVRVRGKLTQGAASAIPQDKIFFCDPATLQYAPVKDNGEECLNDYECASNSCLESECVAIATEIREQTGLLKRIFCAIGNPVDFGKRNGDGEDATNNDYIECITPEAEATGGA